MFSMTLTIPQMSSKNVKIIQACRNLELLIFTQNAQWVRPSRLLSVKMSVVRLGPSWAGPLFRVRSPVCTSLLWFCSCLDWGGTAYSGDCRLGNRKQLLLYSVLNIPVGFFLVSKWWIHLGSPPPIFLLSYFANEFYPNITIHCFYIIQEKEQH